MLVSVVSVCANCVILEILRRGVGVGLVFPKPESELIFYGRKHVLCDTESSTNVVQKGGTRNSNWQNWLGKVRFLWGGWVFLGVSFLKSWPSPLDQQKKSMTIHKRWPKNVWPSPSPLNPSWYYWSLLTGWSCIVTHCHNTVAKCAEFHLVYVMKLSSNVVPATIRTNITFVCFVQERTSVNFKSERKCCGVDQMF